MTMLSISYTEERGDTLKNVVYTMTDPTTTPPFVLRQTVSGVALDYDSAAFQSVLLARTNDELQAQEYAAAVA